MKGICFSPTAFCFLPPLSAFCLLPTAYCIQDSGFRKGKNRSQDSGVRSQNEGHLLFADCLLPTAHCLLQSQAVGGEEHRGSRPPLRLGAFNRNFVTTLADLRGELDFRIVGYVLIRQLTDCHLLLCPSHGATPTQPACSAGPAVRSVSPRTALPATRVLAAPQTGQSALGLAAHGIQFLRTSRPDRQSHNAVEKPSVG